MTARMPLNIVESGSGDRCAVLLHGMMGSAESWWRIAPRLVDAGYRVLALDLPGHGLSPRDPTITLDGAIEAVVETLRQVTTPPPIVAIGHSYGGRLLAAAADRIKPELSIYVDAPFSVAGGADREAVLAGYETARRRRTPAWLRTTRPHYRETDAVVEGRAAARFDPATSASIAASTGGAWLPTPGSIVVRAEPSEFVSARDAADLEARGVRVRSIPSASHSVWYSHFDEFVAVLPEVFTPPAVPDVGGPE
ncbi:alpha/beta fold hydrolase [Microbacterium rhizophilus]|uniref:alpha/beta fold hydrolase n=1 Tax=Microbacterium rhizophilus TaxID=3138934 RepID=UPI0031E5B886